MITFFWHCDFTLTSAHYFVATAAVYVPCFIYPWLRTVFEYKWTQQALIHVENNGFTRITIPAKFHWTPGQHCFLRFTGFGITNAVSTHPFTICSSPPRSVDEPSELVFYVRHQKGFTARLYQYGLDHPGVSVPVLVDGPYGGVNTPRLRDADRLLVLAGGSGAGWCLPFIEYFIRSRSFVRDEECGCAQSLDEKEVSPRTIRVQGSASTPISLRVILATRDTSTRIWFERTVGEMLATTSAGDISSSVQVQVYLTGEAEKEADLHSKQVDLGSSQDSASSSSDDKIVNPEKGVQTAMPGKEYEGRPHLPTIVREEATQAAATGESLSVYVCGPGTMQNDVRNAVAAENLRIVKGSQKSGGVYLHSEHFSWA